MKPLFFAVIGFLIGAFAVWVLFNTKEPDKKKDHQISKRIDSLERQSKILNQKDIFWAEYAKKISDSLVDQREKNKKIYEKYLRIKRRRLPVYTEPQLDSAIESVIRYY